MLRFAPNPTSSMSIGDLRIALFNALLSRQRNESLIVRIDDAERPIEGKEVVQLLDLFGIEYRDVVYQSAHLKFYRAMALQLLHNKKAFNCFCTPETLDYKRELSKARHTPYRYDDTCTYLPPEQTIDNENPFTIRLKRPKEPVVVDDIVQGTVAFAPEAIDSFVIMNANKYPTPTFACAVDDMLSDVSLVVRSDEYFSDTPRQIAVRDALGYDKTIMYAHVPPILSETGDNEDTLRVDAMLEAGFLPEAITNYLILAGNETPKEIFTFDEAVAWFDLENVSKNSVTFDVEKLRDINREHLKALDDRALSTYVGFADDDIGRLARLYLDDIATTKELKAKVAAVFGPKTIPDAYCESAAAIKTAIQAAPFFETFDAFTQHIAATTGIEGEALLRSLSWLLTGSKACPHLGAVYDAVKNYLGEIVK